MTHAPLVSEDDRSALHDPRHHLSTLTRLSNARLAEGDPFGGFIFADRRCRVGAPFAHDLLLRGEALRRLGLSQAAGEDLARAVALDPTDPIVNHRLIEAGGEPGETAARWVVGDPRASRALVEAAVLLLFERGHGVVGSLTVEGRRLTGWITWHERRAFTLRVRTEGGHYEVPLEPRGGLRGASRSFPMPVSLALASPFVGVSVLSPEGPWPTPS